MNATGPVLAGMVLGLIAFSMSNNSSADTLSSTDRADGAAQGAASSGNEASDDADHRDGGGRGAGREGSAFPDTGGVPTLQFPAGADGTATVTLTFDDGPHPVYTPQVLDMLAAHDTTAIFCVVGEKVRERPELVQRIVTDGHTLCNHSYGHDHELSDKPGAEIDKDITDTLDAIADAVPGVPVPFYRQPGTFVTPQVAPHVTEHGMAVLDWTVDLRDWQRPDASTIVKRLADQLHPGAVVLLHDGGGDRTETVKALAQILVALDDAGYQTVIPEVAR